MAKSKKNFFSRIGDWFRGMKSELKKVIWPTAKQTTNNSLVVFGTVAVFGVGLWALDYVASAIVQALMTLFG